MWDGLTLGYTESTGHPLLRREIAALYDEHRARRRPRLRRGGGGHLLPGQRPARSRRPRHRDLARLPEPVRGRARDRRATSPSTSCARTPAGRSTWRLLRGQLTPATRLIVVNAPHNPTGMLPDRATFDGLVALAAEAGAHLVVDEVYRFLEFDPADRLPAGADALRSRRVDRRHVEVVRDGRPAHRLAGDPRPRPAGSMRPVQGLHDDLLRGPVRGAGAHRPARARRGAGAVAGDIVDDQPRAARRLLRRAGRTASRGSGHGPGRSASRG